MIYPRTRKKSRGTGFTIVELVIVVGIIGTLSAVAIPSYISQLCRAKTSETEATIGSLKAIISSYIDETGAVPTTWDHLTSISAIMTNNGQASGMLSDPITTPSGTHQISVDGPTNLNSIYNIVGNPINGCGNVDIKACLDVSTGASDQRRGDGNNPAETPICT